MEAVNQKLALFKTTPEELGIESIKWIEYRPTSQLTHGAAITFSIPPSPVYMDLKRSRLHVKCRILVGDGTHLPAIPPGISNIPDEAKVGPINNVLGSLFSQMDISLQQQVITSTVSTNYPYKAYLDTLLTTDYSAQTKLLARLFYPDRLVNEITDKDPVTGTNYGLTSRCLFFRESKEVDMEGPLFMDICQQDRLILDGVAVDIKCYPKSEPFVLISTNSPPSYKLEITDVVLKVCMVQVSPGIITGHSRALEWAPARYPIHRSDIKTFAVPQGQFSLTVEDVFQGTCPDQVLVGLVSSSAYNGSYTTNPFNFKHYKCNFAAFYVDGQSVPARPLQPNYETDNYMDAYVAFVTGLGTSEAPYYDTIVSKYDFKNGYCFYFFDLSYQRDLHSESKKGNARLELKFAEALPESVTAVLYAKFPATVEINKSRRVTILS